MPYTSKGEAFRAAARLLQEAGVVDVLEIMSITAALGKMKLDEVSALLEKADAVTRLKSLAEGGISRDAETPTGAGVESAAGVYGAQRQQRVQAALQQYAPDYDRSVGEQLLKWLLFRQASTPIALDSSARELGRHFPLLGYGPVIKALVEVLEVMEHNLRLKTADDYQRLQHILQLAGPPGLGKTTAATAIWAALHYACRNRSSSFLQTLFPSRSHDWKKMHARIMSSLSPSKMLVFSLDFSQTDLKQLQPEEEKLKWERILALRLLYSVLSPKGRAGGYAEFIKSPESEVLRQHLTPCDVAAFVRQQAGFKEADKLLMVWVFDEAQSFQAPSQPANEAPHIAQLLSAFVDFKVQCYKNESPTLPVCVTATTLRSSTSLNRTNHSRAKITDLQLLPLADAHCAYVFNDVCERIKLCQQQPKQEQQHGSEGPQGLQQQQQQQQEGHQQGHQGPEGQQQHMSDHAADVVCQQTQWPAFELHSSADVNAAGVQLPEDTMDLMRLVGGIPRLLSFALAAMAGGKDGDIIYAEKMLCWQSKPSDDHDFDCAKQRAVSSARCDLNWWGFNRLQSTRRLLEIAFAHDVCQEPVNRKGTVVLPDGCRISGGSRSSGGGSSSSSKAVAPQTTWDGGEQAGLWLLMTLDGLRRLLSEGGGLPDQSDDGGEQGKGGYFVRVIPLIMAAFPPTTYEPPIVSLPVLRGETVSWRQRELLDVAVLMVRCLVASQVFGKKSMSLLRLLKGREPSQRGGAGLLSTELLLPQNDTDVQIIDKQLDAAEIDQLVMDYMQQLDRRPFAVAGLGNIAADGWLVLREAAPDGTDTIKPGSPLIVYTSSKQREKREYVKADDIVQQRDQDVISTQYSCVHACITDQTIADAPTAEESFDVVVISPQEHEAFYRCCAQLLRVSKV